jgi:hypothetical protein
MGKTYGPHRVVIRNENDRIISDEEFEHFAAAKPAYDDTQVPDGCIVTLQHGARVIFKKGS